MTSYGTITAAISVKQASQHYGSKHNRNGKTCCPFHNIRQHNLNKYPSITVVDSAGSCVVGEVDYKDMNTLTVTFSGAFSGKAFLN